MEKELIERKEEQHKLKEKLENEHLDNMKKTEEEWLKRVDDLKEVVAKKLEGTN